jgi:Fe-S-cluster-containing hydrogenase component 2
MPRPVDFIASNYTISTDTDACTACLKCIDRCPMDAISFEKDIVVTSDVRCIGCGVCVPICNADARKLVMKDAESVPPENVEDLYAILQKGKKNRLQKLSKGIRAKMGLKTGRSQSSRKAQ